MNAPRQLRAIFAVLFFLRFTVWAQPLLNGENSVQSFSGTFIVNTYAGYSPLAHNPAVVTNAFFVRLEPTLLAISAERFKDALYRDLGLPAGVKIGGKIYFMLRPARSLQDEIVFTAQPFLRNWNCRVELPDVMTQPRFARTLAAVLLLEIANQHAARTSHSAEIPAWLADGLGQEMLAEDQAKIILSMPGKSLNGVPQTRLDETTRGMDSLADARRILRESSVLTFDQLSWPSAAQLSGDDGGAYRASAQLFVTDLLKLKNGPAQMRAFLQRLPNYENWQMAFFAAFQENFRRPLDVEKWWSLRVLNFAAQAHGPRWTAAESHDRMIELLSVPVDFRSTSNSLPEHAEISLQDTIRNLPPAERIPLLQTKLRDLELARLQMAPAYAGLIDGYCQALGDFLGEKKKNVRAGNKYPVPMRRFASVADTVKKLNALDLRRRAIESKPFIGVPNVLNRSPH